MFSGCASGEQPPSVSSFSLSDCPYGVSVWLFKFAGSTLCLAGLILNPPCLLSGLGENVGTAVVLGTQWGGLELSEEG